MGVRTPSVEQRLLFYGDKGKFLLAVCRTMKLSIHRGKELLAFKITCSNSFLPILFFLNESTGWNKRDGALKCAYTLIQTRHNRIFSTWFTQYMHPF